MGFSLGGIFKSLVNPMSLMQLAMGPAGWASLAMKTIGMAVAQQVIQKLGQELGLPPALIGVAQAAFSAAAGQPNAPVQSLGQAVHDLVSEFALSPMQAGQLERAAKLDVMDIFKGVQDAMKEGENKATRGSTAKKGDWLRIIAEQMGKAMDSKVKEMRKLGADMDTARQAEAKNPKGEQNSIKINTDLTVATQEFSMLMNSTSNMIKTIGEGLSTMARKN